MLYNVISKVSPKVFEILKREEGRQRSNIELIASENFCSPAVQEAMGSCFTNKYCEGYPDVEPLLWRLSVCRRT